LCRPSRVPAAGTADVSVEITGDLARVVVAREGRHNALDAATLQRLLDALGALIPVIADEPSVRVELRGAGPSFSSGGDLSEFGTFTDPADAHVVRLTRSIGRHLAAMADRVTAYLHGWCLGAGIELPAFVHHVVAEPATTRIGLPELALGLIPGAGGTVSVTRRVGRQRTMLLALTGDHLDAHTALEWGLVDGLDPATSW
jgi:enoyl-CoA hydratase/carnithine racemase